MINNTKVNHIEEQLFGAVDVIVHNRLQEVKYDQTIKCIIVSNENKKEGKYRVEDENGFQFDAYAEKTDYSKNAMVYVTIPQGDYSQQKIIVGHVQGKDAIKPYNYVSPFEQFFPLTNNLLPSSSNTWGLAANGDVTSTQIAKLTSLSETAHKILGIRADFKTLLDTAIVGNYGLVIQIKTNNGNNYEYAFSAEDMIGNPYNFSNYYTQEKLIFLDGVQGAITEIIINLVQVKGTFKDIDGELIRVSKESIFDPNGGATSIESKNIHVKKVEMFFGIMLSEKTEEFVEIYSIEDGNFDGKNEASLSKSLGLRWVHMDKDGNPFNMQLSSSQEKFSNFEIRWYRYNVGAPAADQYSSVYWEYAKDYDKNKKQNFNLEVILNGNLSVEKFKVIAFVNGTPYRSNIIEFENSNPSSKEEITRFVNPLTIVENDNSNGNYMLYRQDLNILENSLSKQERGLSCYFDETPEDGKIGSKLSAEENTNIKWIFPATNTMIILLDQVNKYLGEDEQEYNSEEELKNAGTKIKSYIVENNYNPKYQIKNRLNIGFTNNTVFCSYLDNQGSTYSTTAEFTFGVAGTMGTEQTLIIDFADNSNAVQVKIDEDDEEVIVKFKVQLYDLNGKNLDVSEIIWKWKDQEGQLTSITPPLGETIPDGELWLSRNDNFTNMNVIKILQCSVGPLTTYFPIPLCSNTSSYKYIDGPTQVIYKPDGVPQMYKAEYKIYNANGNKIDGVEWNVYSSDASLIGQPTIESNLLKPYSLYLQNASQYAVQAKLNGNIIWTQPILTIMNRWPSNIVNSWSGTNLIDNENNVMITQAFAAGKKDTDNTFTGVMLGDWSEKDTNNSITQNTGLYGFRQGKMSYAFKDDGTAFIGESGSGRIEFKGNEGKICGGFIDKDSYKTVIDLANGNVKLGGSIELNGSISWGASNSPVLVLYAQTSLNKPTDKFNNTVQNADWKEYSDYAESSTTTWHRKYNASDSYASYSYDGGQTWTAIVQIKGEKGDRGPTGPQGSSANVPEYIKETYIDLTSIESPNIFGGIFRTSSEGRAYAKMTNNEFVIYDMKTNGDTTAKASLGYAPGATDKDGGLIELVLGAGWQGDSDVINDIFKISKDSNSAKLSYQHSSNKETYIKFQSTHDDNGLVNGGEIIVSGMKILFG